MTGYKCGHVGCEPCLSLNRVSSRISSAKTTAVLFLSHSVFLSHSAKRANLILRHTITSLFKLGLNSLGPSCLRFYPLELSFINQLFVKVRPTVLFGR